jgi:hypothetical protein
METNHEIPELINQFSVTNEQRASSHGVGLLGTGCWAWRRPPGRQPLAMVTFPRAAAPLSTALLYRSADRTAAREVLRSLNAPRRPTQRPWSLTARSTAPTTAQGRGGWRGRVPAISAAAAMSRLGGAWASTGQRG